MSMIEKLHNLNESAKDIQWIIIRMSQVGLGNMEVYPPPPINTSVSLSSMVPYSSNQNPRQINGYDKKTKELVFAFGPFYADWEISDFVRSNNISVF